MKIQGLRMDSIQVDWAQDLPHPSNVVLAGGERVGAEGGHGG